MSNTVEARLKQLQDTFPRLSGENQHYVMGLAEGLRQAQARMPRKQRESARTAATNKGTGISYRE